MSWLASVGVVSGKSLLFKLGLAGAVANGNVHPGALGSTVTVGQLVVAVLALLAAGASFVILEDRRLTHLEEWRLSEHDVDVLHKERIDKNIIDIKELQAKQAQAREDFIRYTAQADADHKGILAAIVARQPQTNVTVRK